eukprot:9324768-Prorocentrum_lima.AAC.1
MAACMLMRSAPQKKHSTSRMGSGTGGSEDILEAEEGLEDGVPNRTRGRTGASYPEPAIGAAIPPLTL